MGPHDAGIPIYIKYIVSDEIKKEEHKDPTLGIALGVLLSVFCIILCMWLILYQRKCNKQNQPRPLNYSTSATGHPPPPITCTTDLHEMQTLITKPEPIVACMPNGKVKMNGKDTSQIFSEIVPANHRPISSSTPVMPKRVGGSGGCTTATVAPTDSGYDAIFNCANIDEVKGNGDLPTIKEEDKGRQINGHSVMNGFAGKQPSDSVNSVESIGEVVKATSPLPTPAIIKANGNLRITENPQVGVFV